MSDIFFPYKLHVDKIEDAIQELSDPIENKDEFYTQCILDRLQHCSEVSMGKFSESLDKIFDIDMTRALQKRDYQEIHKVIRYTNKITSKMHRSLLQLLRHLQSN